MQIAVFDVCDTIYNVNTTFSFLDNFFANNRKYIFFRKVSKFLPVKFLSLIFFKVFKKDLIRNFGTSFLNMKDIEEIQKYAHKFVYDHLINEIKDVTVKKIKSYKSQGYKIVLMSGSYSFIIEEVAKYFNVDHFFASKLNINGKHYTGKYTKDILLNKYQILKNEFKHIDKLVVVSNNKTDLELMRFADRSFAICNKKSDKKFWQPFNDITIIEDFK